MLKGPAGPLRLLRAHPAVRGVNEEPRRLAVPRALVPVVLAVDVEHLGVDGPEREQAVRTTLQLAHQTWKEGGPGESRRCHVPSGAWTKAM